MFQGLLSINIGGGIGGVGNMLGHNGLALGGGDLVGHIGTGHLGDGVAVLNLDGDLDDLGVVNAVLGGDLTAGVLHGGLQRVSNSVGGHRGGGIGGVVVGSSQELRVSLGISLSLGNVVSGTCQVIRDLES